MFKWIIISVMVVFMCVAITGCALERPDGCSEPCVGLQQKVLVEQLQ